MHAIMMSGQPAALYMQPGTMRLLHAIRAWREDGLGVFFTLDAGPNVHVLCEGKDAAEVRQRIEALVPGLAILENCAGPGVRVQTTCSEHGRGPPGHADGDAADRRQRLRQAHPHRGALRRLRGAGARRAVAIHAPPRALGPSGTGGCRSGGGGARRRPGRRPSGAADVRRGARTAVSCPGPTHGPHRRAPLWDGHLGCVGRGPGAGRPRLALRTGGGRASARCGGGGEAFHGTPSGIDHTVGALEAPLWFVRGQSPQVLRDLEPLPPGPLASPKPGVDRGHRRRCARASGG